jgi:hypothetical protein
MTQFMDLHIKGTAKDAHEKFPIRYDISEKGSSFFIGCRVEAEVTLDNGTTITKRMDIRAFAEVADQLAHIQDGDQIEVKASYDMQKSQKDGKYYPVATVTEVISA